MNGRILVLIGAVGLFIAAWSTGARQPVPVTQVNRVEFAAQQVPSVPRIPVMPSVVRPRTMTWDGAAPEIVVPESLVAGRYRVVSDQGDVAALVITGPDSTVQSPITTEMSGSVCWYFIRLQSPVPAVAVRGLPVTASTIAVDDSPSTWNSKERDILLAQLRNLIATVDFARHAWCGSQRVIDAAAASPVATIAQVDAAEVGDLPEFSELPQFNDSPVLADFPEPNDAASPAF